MPLSERNRLRLRNLRLIIPLALVQFLPTRDQVFGYASAILLIGAIYWPERHAYRPAFVRPFLAGKDGQIGAVAWALFFFVQAVVFVLFYVLIGGFVNSPT